jgi:hypothetical protein
MAGGAELEQLSHELESEGGAVADLGRSMEEDVEELGITSQHDASTDAATAATGQEGSSHP